MPGVATAQQVDPRYPYTVELDVGPSLSSGLRGFGVTRTVLATKLNFLGPAAENVQISGSARYAAAFDGRVSEYGIAGGLRRFTEWDPWITRIDTQIIATVAKIYPATDYSFGIGPHLAIGAQRVLPMGWRVGLDMGVAFVVINPRVDLDLHLAISYHW